MADVLLWQILHRLISALESAAMENFIPKGDISQRTALGELNTSNIAIFLISPYYGIDITKCEFTETCKAGCGMKTREENISYTWCEFRVAVSEDMAHLVYIIDEGWDTVSSHGNFEG